MDYFGVFDISAAGMNVERLRLQAAATNLANAHTTASANGVAYKPLEVVVRSGSDATSAKLFENYMNKSLMELTPRAQLRQVETSPRLVYEPNHPDADERGYVAYPGINPVTEMVGLIAITRAYEANIRVLDAARNMAQRALDIGSNR